MERRNKKEDLDWLARQQQATAQQQFNEDVMHQQISDVPQIGRIFESSEMLNQEMEYISDGIDDHGHEYQLFLGKISRAPIIRNPKTNCHFILPWSDIIALATAAGLNR